MAAGVVSAASVAEARAAAAEEKIALVVSDIGLPDGDGYELMAELRTRRPALSGIAISGYGIAYVPEDLVSHHLAEGRLTLVLDDWSPPFPGYHLYYPSRRQMPAALQAFINVLKAHAR